MASSRHFLNAFLLTCGPIDVTGLHALLCRTHKHRIEHLRPKHSEAADDDDKYEQCLFRPDVGHLALLLLICSGTSDSFSHFINIFVL